LTAKNYEQFAVLHDRYAEQGLVILAFPCNQFGRQEPKPNAEIKQFAADHGAKFPLFDKIDVNGKHADPIYKFLRARLTGTLSSALKWNFTKFICNRRGVPVARFGPYTAPLEMEDIIKELLAEKPEEAARSASARVTKSPSPNDADSALDAMESIHSSDNDDDSDGDDNNNNDDDDE